MDDHAKSVLILWGPLQYQPVIQIDFVAVWTWCAAKNTGRSAIGGFTYAVVIYYTPTMLACHIVR